MKKTLLKSEPILNLQIEGEFTITGRGIAIIVDLVKNGYDLTQGQLNFFFMSKVIQYKGEVHRIIGIERMGMDSRKADKTSFLLKPFGAKVSELDKAYETFKYK